LGEKIKALYKDGGVFPEPILNLKWDYETDGAYDPHKVAKEINGYFVKDVTIKGKTFKKGTLVPSFAFLQADGSTSSGNWLYCNSYTEKGNMAARRGQKDAANNIGLFPEFAWCWPVNRRIIYNRASVDAKGIPWDRKDWVVYFKGEEKDGQVRLAKMDGGCARRRLVPDAESGRIMAGRRQVPLYHAQARPCPDLRAGPGGWPFSRALRTPGVPGGKKLS
jgi:formate dehydrogenase major subunit